MLTFSIFEIFEIVLSTLLLLVLIGGIFFVTDSDAIYSRTLNHQISYSTSLSDSNTLIQFNIDKKVNIVDSKNEYEINLDNSFNIRNTYLGEDRKISSQTNQVVISEND